MNLFAVSIILFGLIEISLCASRIPQADGSILQLPDDKIINDDGTPVHRSKKRGKSKKKVKKTAAVKDETEEVCEKCKKLKENKARKIEQHTVVAEKVDSIDDDMIAHNVIARYRIRIPLRIIPPPPEIRQVYKNVPSAVPVPKPYPVIQRVNVPQYVPQPYPVPFEVTKKVKVPYPVPVPVKPKLRVGYKKQTVMKPYVYHDGYAVKKSDVRDAYTGKEHEGLTKGRAIDDEHQEFDEDLLMQQFKDELEKQLGRTAPVSASAPTSAAAPVSASAPTSATAPVSVSASAPVLGTVESHAISPSNAAVGSVNMGLPSSLQTPFGGYSFSGVPSSFQSQPETNIVARNTFEDQSVIWSPQSYSDLQGRYVEPNTYSHEFEPRQFVEG